MAMIWIAHVNAYDPAVPGEITLYFASASYTSSAANYPTGGAAHTFYDPRIKQPAIMSRDVFDSATTFGASKVGVGAMELVNLDGGLDGMAAYGLDGRAMVLMLGEINDGDSAPTWTTILTGTMEQPEISWDKVTLRIRDRQAELDKPINLSTYTGDNVLPDGLEGVEGDLKGKSKPVLLGQVFNIAPPLVNTSKLIYQLNDGALNSVDAVYDRALALTAGTAYASEAAMLSTAPTAGQYRAWLAGGYIRLGSSPDGQITCDATQGATAADRTVAQLLKTIAVDYAGIDAGDIIAADVTALDTDNSAVVGYWTDSDSHCKVAMDEICNSIGAWYGFNSLGKLNMARFELPTGTPVAHIINADIISINKIVSNDAGRGIAAWKIILNYKKIYTTQTSDIAGAVTDARKAELINAYRTIEKTDVTVKTKHLLAPDITLNTLLVSASDATAEAERRLAIYSVDRAIYQLRVAMDSAVAASIDLGQVVTIELSRFGMETGNDYLVIGIRPNLQLKLIDLTVWG